MKKLFLVSCLCFGFSSGFAKNSTLPEVPDIPFTKTVLANGLTVIVHEDHKAPIVTVNVWYHVGSKNEPEGKFGFAHLFEHLMFQGSENYNDDYFKFLDKIGATDYNGTTNEDRTNYFQNVPSSALDSILFMESDRMGHFLGVVSQARLDEQRKVVLNEKRQGDNRPYWGIAQELIFKGAFPAGHPYSHTTIGSEEDLNSATLKDVQDWFKTYYGPNNAVLTIVGDVQTKDAIEKANKYFGDIPPGPRIAQMKKWVAPRSESVRQRVQDKVPFSKIYKIWNVPEIGSADLEKLDFVSDILTSGKSSRLFKEVFYDQQLVTDISATVWPGEIASFFVVDATLKPGVNFEQVEKSLEQVFSKFLKNGPTEAELKKVKTQYASNFISGVEQIGGFGGKANLLAGCEVYEDDPGCFRRHYHNRMKFTPSDIKAAAVRWLSEGDYNLEITPYPDFVSTAGINRKDVPYPASYPKADFPELQTATLSNGMKVILAKRQHLPKVSMALMINTGYSQDPKDKLGLTTTTFDLSDEGTTKQNLFQISEKLANLGSSIGAFSGMNYSGYVMNSLSNTLEPTMSLLAEMILYPAFPEKELTRLKTELIESIQADKANPEAMGSRIMAQLLYGKDHPYGVPLAGKGFEETVKSITLKDVKEFYTTWVKPNNTTVVAVGDIELSTLTRLMEEKFAKWAPGKVPSTEISLPKQEANRGKMFVVHRPFAPTTMIYAAQFFPSFQAEKEIPLVLMNQILGGTFTSRINLNLREEKGWSYGSRSSIISLEGPRFFSVRAPVQTDKTGDSVSEIIKEIEGLTRKTKPITQGEVEKRKTTLLQQLAGSWETNGEIGNSVQSLIIDKAPLDWHDTYADRLQKVSVTDVIPTAGEIRPKDMVWLLVGDQDKIIPQVKKLGFQPTLLDGDGRVIP